MHCRRKQTGFESQSDLLQHDKWYTFSLFFVRVSTPSLRNDFPDLPTSSYFIHVPPVVSAVEFTTETRSSEVMFDIFILRWQIYEFNLWTEVCVTSWPYFVCASYSHEKVKSNCNQSLNTTTEPHAGQQSRINLHPYSHFAFSLKYSYFGPINFTRKNIVRFIKSQILRWAAHVIRMDTTRIVKKR
jgi:hypothetical protein